MTSEVADLLQKVSLATLEAHRGNLDAAREAISDIRSTYAIERMPDVSAEVMIAEGICEAYSGNLDAGFDRFRRAALVAHHFGSQPVEQLALSWLAHCEFNRGNPLESVKHIGQAHRSIENARPDARFRIASTIAVLCEYAGMTEPASNWFGVARREASRCGERAMMSSIVFNMATMRIGSAIVSQLQGQPDSTPTSSRTNSLVVESSANYDKIAKVHVQGETSELLAAQNLMANGEYGASLAILDRIVVNSGDLAPVDIARARFSRAWCCFRSDLYFTDAGDLIESLNEFSDDDDLAFAYAVLSKVCRQENDLMESERQRAISLHHLNNFVLTQRLIENDLAAEGLCDVPEIWAER